MRKKIEKNFGDMEIIRNRQKNVFFISLFGQKCDKNRNLNLNFGKLYYLNRFEQNQFSHSTICYHIEIEVTNFYATH